MLLAAAEVRSLALLARLSALLEYLRDGGDLPGMREALGEHSLPELPRVVAARRMVLRIRQLTTAVLNRQSFVLTCSETRSQ
jgi:hypothetical protein